MGKPDPNGKCIQDHVTKISGNTKRLLILDSQKVPNYFHKKLHREVTKS